LVLTNSKQKIVHLNLFLTVHFSGADTDNKIVMNGTFGCNKYYDVKVKPVA